MTAPTKTTWPCGLCLKPITNKHAWVSSWGYHIHATCFEQYTEFIK